MRKPINLYQAKTRFSELVDRAAAGEEFVIAKAGRPMARLVPLAPAIPARVPGSLKGKLWVAPDFDAPDPELEKLFHDTPVEPD
jgi:prevent-host-death family protein